MALIHVRVGKKCKNPAVRYDGWARASCRVAIESVHARLRKIIKTRGHFPSDEAATKLIWLALRNITAEWSRATREWKAAMNQFAIIYEDRFTLAR